MEIIIVQLILAIFGFGLQASSYIEAHPTPQIPLNPPLQKGEVEVDYEINDVPNNITLHIDGYEFAYPIRTEILGASSHNPTTNSYPHLNPNPHPYLNPPQSPFVKGEVFEVEVFNREEGQPRYYILAEPILFRRAGDSEWKPIYNHNKEY